jgi:hypothetical protein
LRAIRVSLRWSRQSIPPASINVALAVGHDGVRLAYVRSVSEKPTGSFLYAKVVDGTRYEVFGSYGDDFDDGFVRYDVYDRAGNWLTDGVLLEKPPGESRIRLAGACAAHSAGCDRDADAVRVATAARRRRRRTRAFCVVVAVALANTRTD